MHSAEQWRFILPLSGRHYSTKSYGICSWKSVGILLYRSDLNHLQHLCSICCYYSCLSVKYVFIIIVILFARTCKCHFNNISSQWAGQKGSHRAPITAQSLKYAVWQDILSVHNTKNKQTHKKEKYIFTYNLILLCVCVCVCVTKPNHSLIWRVCRRKDTWSAVVLSTSRSPGEILRSLFNNCCVNVRSAFRRNSRWRRLKLSRHVCLIHCHILTRKCWWQSCSK